MARCLQRIPLLISTASCESAKRYARGYFVLKKKVTITTRQLVFLALMAAMNVVLGRFSIQILPEVRVSVLGFLPMALAGVLMGPVYGALTGMVGDILNYLLFTHVFGPYFPGYTVVAALSGMWYGLTLRGCREISWKRAAWAIIPVILVGEMVLNSIWVYIMYSKTFWANLPMRLVTNVIECTIKILLLMGMGKIIARVPKQLFKG